MLALERSPARQEFNTGAAVRCCAQWFRFLLAPTAITDQTQVLTAVPKPLEDMPTRPLLAIGLVSLAMALFSMTDGAAKFLTAAFSPQQILFVRYAAILSFLLPLAAMQKGVRVLVTRRPGLQLLRGLLVAVSSLIYISALQTVPLELCAAVGFVAPLYVTALSIPFLGERVGRHRWAAVGVGFLSVLLILRPGGEGFQVTMLLPLASSLCWAMGLILTRQMRHSEAPLTVLAWSSLVGLVATAPLAAAAWHWPDAWQWAQLISLGLFNAIAQYLVIRAFMLASASLLAPFSYSTLIWTLLISALVFDSFPDAITLVGTAVLVASGLYVWHRERLSDAQSTVIAASLGEAVDEKR